LPSREKNPNIISIVRSATVQIYNESTIYIYKEIFPLEASPPNPCLPLDPPAEGIAPRTPQRGYPPSALPHVEECTYFWGVNTSWGINTVERKDL
jgi:hypothetical protein